MSEPLAADFDAVTFDQWAEQARAGKDIDLTVEVEDSVTTRWIYTPAESLGEDPAGLPGQAPFTRGTRAGRPWGIRQEQVAPGREQANRELLEDLNGGVNELVLRFDRAAALGLSPDEAGFADARGVDGIAISTLDDLDRVLDEVHPEMISVALDAGPAAVAAAALMAAFWKQREIGPESARGSFRIDPTGSLARWGTTLLPVEQELDRAVAVAAETAREWPGVRALGLDTGVYVEAGATAGRELGLAMAGAAELLRAADRAGIEPEVIASQLEFTLAVGSDQFLETAKFRAVRRLWARVLEACGVEAERRHSVTYARTSGRMITGVDPWPNMLRVTTATFAAGVGGADGITVTPFDSRIGHPGDLGRRIARNTQIVLQEESSLGGVADPLAGSWYGEALTDDLARSGWEQFQEIERAGGLVAALRSGLVRDSLAALADTRADDFDHRRRVMTGINEFPLLGEDGTEPVPPDREPVAGDAARLAGGPPVDGLDGIGSGPADGLLARLGAAAADGASIDQLAAALAGDGERIEPLEPRPDAGPFEQLRATVDRHVEAGGDPPRIYLATMGPIAKHVRLANWARSFFEVAGIEAVAGGAVESHDQHAAALREGDLRLVAVCAGADQSPEDVTTLVATLRDTGAERIYMVNSTAELNEAALAAGADELVKNGVSMSEVLVAALGYLGVEVER